MLVGIGMAFLKCPFPLLDIFDFPLTDVGYSGGLDQAIPCTLAHRFVLVVKKIN
jgi:hypothetical protein